MSSVANNRGGGGGGGGGFKTLLSPRRKSSLSKKKNETENPYAALGREKFSALLADVEEKKRMILAEIGADEGDDEPPMIRFVNSEKDGKLRPVVIRANSNPKSMNYRKSDMKMSMTSLTTPIKANYLAQDQEQQTKEHLQLHHHHHQVEAKEVEMEKEETVEVDEEEGDQGSDFVWFGDTNDQEKILKQSQKQQQPPPPPSPEEDEVKTKDCEEAAADDVSGSKCRVQLAAVAPIRLMKEINESSSSSSSRGIRSSSKLQLESSHVYLGVIAVMMLMLLLLFERYWRIYYLLEYQTKICLKTMGGTDQ